MLSDLDAVDTFVAAVDDCILIVLSNLDAVVTLFAAVDDCILTALSDLDAVVTLDAAVDDWILLVADCTVEIVVDAAFPPPTVVAVSIVDSPAVFVRAIDKAALVVIAAIVTAVELWVAPVFVSAVEFMSP